MDSWGQVSAVCLSTMRWIQMVMMVAMLTVTMTTTITVVIVKVTVMEVAGAAALVARLEVVLGLMMMGVVV